jgi:hypothetical protein
MRGNISGYPSAQSPVVLPYVLSSELAPLVDSFRTCLLAPAQELREIFQHAHCLSLGLPLIGSPVNRGHHSGHGRFRMQRT